MKDTSLIIGADGFIGGALAQLFSGRAQPFVATTRRQDSVSPKDIHLNLAEVPENWELPFKFEAAYICAGVSSYEECRRNPASSRLINVTNTSKIARRLVESNVFVVYLSSNAVFDGGIPYCKTSDAVSPQTEYGRQKADAEDQLLKLGEKICIVRLTKVFSKKPQLLMEWISRLQNGEPIHPFRDLTCAPLLLDNVAETLVSIARKKLPGIWHFSGDRDITYAELAHLLISRLHKDPSLVQPVSVKTSPFYLEHVPAHTTLDCSGLTAKLGIEPPLVREIIDSLAPI